jgi:hypothetical protein
MANGPRRIFRESTNTGIAKNGSSIRREASGFYKNVALPNAQLRVEHYIILTLDRITTSQVSNIYAIDRQVTKQAFD